MLRRILAFSFFISFILLGYHLAYSQCSCSSVFTSQLFGFNQTQFGGNHDPNSLTFGKARSWDSSPFCGWNGFETSPGVYNFTNCDTFVNKAISQNSKPQFVWGRTPCSQVTGSCTGGYAPNGGAQLAKDIDGANTITVNALTALANHMKTAFPGVPWSIEGRNESDLTNECAENSSIGGHCSAIHLVKEQKTIYQTLKAIDPTIQVLCPAASTFNHFGPHGYNGTDAASPPFNGNGWINAGILTWCDAINLHPYFFATVPEEAVNGGFTAGSCTGNGGLAFVACLASNAGKPQFPIESSETNYGNASTGGSNTMSDALKFEWIGRYHIYAIDAGVRNITWYQWECAGGVLANCFGTLFFGGVNLPEVQALATIQDWFIGASGFACSHPSSTWTCSVNINTASGKKGAALIVFNNAGSTPSVSGGGHAKAYRMDGTSSAIIANSYTVDGQPTLLF